MLRSRKTALAISGRPKSKCLELPAWAEKGWSQVDFPGRLADVSANSPSGMDAVSATLEQFLRRVWRTAGGWGDGFRRRARFFGFGFGEGDEPQRGT